MSNPVDQFRRAVNSAAGMYYRIDSGTLTGRNAASTDAGIAAAVARARAILSADVNGDSHPLCDYLDSPRGARLAAKWDRVERRFYGVRP